MPRAVGCVWVVGAHAPSYWSYFMAKLFREKNNSISVRYRVTVASWLPSSTDLSPLADSKRRSQGTENTRIGFHFRPSTSTSQPIVTREIKAHLVGGKLISPSLFLRVLAYEMTGDKEGDKLFTRHGRIRFLRRGFSSFFLYYFCFSRQHRAGQESDDLCIIETKFGSSRRTVTQSKCEFQTREDSSEIFRIYISHSAKDGYFKNASKYIETAIICSGKILTLWSELSF